MGLQLSSTYDVTRGKKPYFTRVHQPFWYNFQNWGKIM